MLYYNRKIYSKLPQHARALYSKGFPGFAASDLDTRLLFQDYSYGLEVPKRMSALTQQAFVEHYECDRTYVIGCYSYPTDHQAFLCAGRMAHRMMETTSRSIQCFSVMDICDSWRDIPPAMFYAIYGIDSNMSPGQTSALRSFLYARDGSIRVLIMTGEGTSAPWEIVKNKLHIHMNGLIVLAESESTMQAGAISEKATRRNRVNI